MRVHACISPLVVLGVLREMEVKQIWDSAGLHLARFAIGYAVYMNHHEPWVLKTSTHISKKTKDHSSKLPALFLRSSTCPLHWAGVPGVGTPTLGCGASSDHATERQSGHRTNGRCGVWAGDTRTQMSVELAKTSRESDSTHPQKQNARKQSSFQDNHVW